jgi:hypothetical protein
MPSPYIKGDGRPSPKPKRKMKKRKPKVVQKFNKKGTKNRMMYGHGGKVMEKAKPC